jgi:DNA segregation ATPase FtsK/SpoIIIE, S-DNA-T family
VQFDESEFPGDGEEPADSDNSCDVSTEDSGSRGMPDPVNSNSDDDSESYGEDGDDSEGYGEDGNDSEGYGEDGNDSESYGENGDDSESYGEDADNEASQGDLSKEIRRPKRERRPPERMRLAQTLL